VATGLPTFYKGVSALDKDFFLKNDKNKRDKLSKLRKKAEALLIDKGLSEEDASKLSPERVRRLVQALTVHQVELEMQNEELRQAQANLEKLKDKYVDLYDFAPVGYLTLNDQGLIVEANLTATRLLGTERNKLLKKLFSHFVCKGDLDSYHFCFKRLLATQSQEKCELKLKRNDGTEFFAELEAVPVEDGTGESRLFRAILSDISERKRAEEELKNAHDELEQRVKARTEELQLSNAALEHSNADLQQFAYVASHDLQEPLRNVVNCLQMLEQDYKSRLDANADRYIQYAVDSTVQMKDLILGLLAYSRVTTKGKLPELTDCEQILERALNNLSLAITESGSVVTHDALPKIFADDTQMLQVLQNLIQNAIRFRGDNPPQIHLSAVKNRNEWIFSIKDNGIGIESRHLDRIFVIFQRLHKRDKYDGTGIGLAIVKKIVERHGGRIWVESEPGEGATFYFTIPEKAIQA
jgi:chemotaxis family two-component system sensor kinase Cph1